MRLSSQLTAVKFTVNGGGKAAGLREFAEITAKWAVERLPRGYFSAPKLITWEQH